MKRTIKSFVLVLLLFVSTAQAAFAYIDPNTGGMLFQMLATSFAVLTGVALLFSRQIRSLLGRARRSLRRGPGGEGEQADGPSLDASQPDDLGQH